MFAFSINFRSQCCFLKSYYFFLKLFKLGLVSGCILYSFSSCATNLLFLIPLRMFRKRTFCLLCKFGFKLWLKISEFSSWNCCCLYCWTLSLSLFIQNKVINSVWIIHTRQFVFDIIEWVFHLFRRKQFTKSLSHL